MRLKRIELYGFKSFGQKTVLHFDQPISVIVGPNGSGKSNIADAIRWVLGEQSAKSLRGGKMEDVIFSGTDQKKPLNMTQVSLVLDNRDQKLPVAYDEVVVTRKLFRSGETAYAINRSGCRLKDIRALFMDTGVGKEGYSIIGQGRIEEIISAKDTDRRELFEEATGISKFRYQIEEARSKLKKTKENLVRIEDILSQLKEQLRYLSKEADKARRGMELSRLHEQHVLAWYEKEMKTAQLQIAGLEEEEGVLKNDRQNAEEEQAAILDKLMPLREQVQALAQEWQQQRDEQTALRQTLETVDRKLQLSQQRAEFLQRDADRLDLQEQTLKKEAARAAQKAEELAEEAEALQTAYSDGKQRAQARAEEVASLRKRTQDCQQQTETLSGEVRRLEKAWQETMLRANTRENAARLRGDQAASVGQSLRTEEERYEKATALHLSRKEQSAAAEAAYEKTVQSLADIQSRLDALDPVIAEQEKGLRMIDRQIETAQGRYQAVEHMIRNHEGYHKSVQQLLRASDQNQSLRALFLGPLSALIRVDQEVQTAMEVALGAAVHQIVTPKATDAKQLIEWLKKNRVGRATFLPIDQIRAYDYRGPFPQTEEGGIGPALDFVEADDKLTGILTSLLGRTCLIEDMDAGIRLRKQKKYDKLRFVTREGELLMPGGSMVGGYTHKDSGLLSRETEKETLAKELSELGGKREQAQQHLARATQKKEELHTLREETRRQGRTIYEERQSAREQLAAAEAQLEVFANSLAQLKQQLADLSSEESDEDLAGELTRLSAEVKEKEQALAVKTEDRTELEQRLREKEQLLTKEEADTDRLERDLSLIRNRRADAEETQQERELDAKKTAEQKLRTTQQQKDERQAQRDLKKKQEQARVREEALAQAILLTERAQTEEKDRQERLETEQKNTADVLAELEKQQATHALRLENAKEKLHRMIETVAVELDVDEAVAADKMKQKAEVETSRAKVRQIRDQLRSIGSFSEESIEEHRAVKERYEFLTGQCEDLTRSGEDLTEVIRSLEKTMRKQFTDGIAEINRKFAEVFRILFDGGQAEVAIAGEDVLAAGVQIIARPPGKSRQAISLLSGGEKALTAVALLFAIFETRPSPFCVLDEIDAALDEANIARYKQYLESFRGSIQFIMITHRRQTMELAERIYGVTMQENKTSRIIPLELAEKKKAQEESA